MVSKKNFSAKKPNKIKIFCIVGTRPEAIKMAPKELFCYFESAMVTVLSAVDQMLLIFYYLILAADIILVMCRIHSE